MTSHAPTTALARGITRPHLVALTVNCVVGAGVLGLPSKVFADVGNWALPIWFLCALWVAAIAGCLAEVGSRYEGSGGAWLYAREAFGDQIGFLTGWLSLVTRVLAFASVCNLLLGYADSLVPGVDSGAGRVAVVTGCVLVLSGVLAVGIRQTAWVSTAATFVKVGLLGAFVAAGLWFVPVAPPPLGPLPETAQIGHALLLMMFAFAGFEVTAVPGAEVRDPPRDIPVAIAVGLSIVAALYFTVQHVCIVALPELASSDRPVAAAAAMFLGPVGGQIIGMGAVVMLFGSLLTQLLTTSRLSHAMAQSGQLPAILAPVHATLRTPLRAILVTGVAAWVATLASSLLTAVAVTVVTRVLTYVVICLALPVLRRRSGAPASAFRLPAGELVAIVATLTSLALLLAASRQEIAATVALCALGAVVGLASKPR